MFRPAALIPHYDHGATVAGVVRPLCAQGLPVLVVDDGSGPDALARLAMLELEGVRVERLPRNRGKGAALVRGFELLAREGFSHALVLDADGQHDPGDAPRFLDAARREPEALILGRPIFDASAPAARLHGRRISQLWTHLETLSLQVADPLCGYRCYPLAATCAVLRPLGSRLRMEIDTELAVRLAWLGVPMVNVPTRVSYPQGGVSHFRMWSDNLRLSRMHAVLCCGMLRRAPGLLARRRARARVTAGRSRA